jgi:hypothetical protein
VNADDLLAELIEVLDEELERLVILRFRLTVLDSLMATDQASWLERSIKDLEVASGQLRLADLRRATATVGLIDEYGLDEDARLDEIAERAGFAWGEMLRERRLRLLEEMAGVTLLVDTAAAAAGSRITLVEEALKFLRSDTAADYGQRRGGTARGGGARLVEGSM